MTDDEAFTPDELLEDGVRYFYQDRRWTNGAGLCVSITRSQQMTMQFLAENGREPRMEPKPKPKPRATSKAAKAKAAIVRAAVNRALAAKASRDASS